MSREEPIMDVIKHLNRELSKLNNRNNKWKQKEKQSTRF